MSTTATITQTEVTEDVRVTVHEEWQVTCDNASTGGERWYQDEAPSDEEVIAHYLEINRIYPCPGQRAGQEVIKTFVNDDPNAERSYWATQVAQWNYAAQTKDTDLVIKVSDLPANYTDADIITYGRSTGQLRND
jgi:hypothetical protein